MLKSEQNSKQRGQEEGQNSYLNNIFYSAHQRKTQFPKRRQLEEVFKWKKDRQSREKEKEQELREDNNK